jgi:hypothetical protein
MYVPSIHGLGPEKVIPASHEWVDCLVGANGKAKESHYASLRG